MFHGLKRDIHRVNESMRRRLHRNKDTASSARSINIDAASDPKLPNSRTDYGGSTSTTAQSSGISPHIDSDNSTTPLGLALAMSSTVDHTEDYALSNVVPGDITSPPRVASASDFVSLSTSALVGSPKAIQSVKTTAWTGFKALLRVLNAGADSFGPLKPAISGLSDCLELFEYESRTRGDYERLRRSLDDLCRDISELIVEDSFATMTPIVASIAQNIEKDVQLIQNMQDRGQLARLTAANEDLDVIMQCYSRIQGHLGRLALNANMNIWKIINEQTADARLNSLSPSSAAMYCSAESESLRRNGCTLNTRIEVLKNLQSWVRDPDGQRVYWLNGMAGTGKTTIAYTLCQQLEASGNLAASFFCSRQLPSCRKVSQILPTIAYQLAAFSRPLRHTITKALEQHPNVEKQRLSRQLECLIATPLRQARESLPEGLVIVIDALNECEDSDGVGRMLSALLANAQDLPVKLCVTSRPDPGIVASMRSEQGERVKLELRLHELEQSAVSADIKTFLTEKLSHLQFDHDSIGTLAERSGVLFIYAATVVRYVDCGNHAWRTLRLKQALDGSLSSESQRTREIDNLYTTILQTGLDHEDTEIWERRQMNQVLRTVVCAQEPITMETIAGLLKIEDDELVYAALLPLLSVLHISEDTRLVTTLHESFRDYLTDRKRSRGFHCDITEYHAHYAQLCFDLIKSPSPPFNICGLESSYMLDCEVQGLATKIDAEIPSHLYYACKYWEAHMVIGLQSKRLLDEALELLSTRLLLWMEIMNLKHRIYSVSRALHRLRVWLQKQDTSDEIRRLAQDAWRFVTEFASSPASESTPHIYISALPLWPSHREVAARYSRHMTGLVKVTGTGMSQREQAPMAICRGLAKVICVTFSPDSTLIASGSTSGVICVWDVHTGEMLGHPLQGHTDWINSVIYSPDGDRIASGSSDSTIRIWDVITGKLVGQPLEGHTDWVDSVAYSPNGKRIASGSSDRTIRIWDVHTGDPVGQPLVAHTDVVKSIAYSPDGTRIASASGDHTVRIWDTETGQMIGCPLQGHTGWVYSVAYSPDGAHVVSGSDDGMICIWEISTGMMQQQPLKGHTDWVRSVAYSPDGTYIVSASSDRTIRIWNAKTGEVHGPPLQGHMDIVASVAYSPDGLHIASGSDDHNTCIWDARCTEDVSEQTLIGHTDRVKSVVYSPDGMRAASGSSDNMIYIWDVHTSQMLGSPLEGHTDWVHSVAFSPDCKHVVSGSDDGSVCIWDADIGEILGKPLLGHTGRVYSVAFSPNGSRIASCSEDRTICIWDANTGEMIGQPLRGHTDWIKSVSYSSNGVYIVSGSDDRTIRLWDAHTGDTLGQLLEKHESGVTSVSCSPDNKYIVSGSSDLTVRIWDVHTGQMCGQPLRGHIDSVRSVAYSPNGAYIVSGSEDCTIRIWDARSGHMLAEPLLGHTGRVASVAYSPDGSFIISGSHDRTIRIWDADPFHATHNPTQALDSSKIDWKLETTGWVVRNDGTRLIWLPPDVRPGLLYPRNAAVISTSGSLNLDFTEAQLGEQWTQCYCR